jgi:hypothetical protein
MCGSGYPTFPSFYPNPIFKNQLLVPTLFSLVWNFIKDISEIVSTRYCDTLDILNNMFKIIILATLHYLVCMFFQCIDWGRPGTYKEVHVEFSFYIALTIKVKKKSLPTYLPYFLSDRNQNHTYFLFALLMTCFHNSNVDWRLTVFLHCRVVGTD